MIDYHLHTFRCCHATGSLEDFLAEAERKKLTEIGFADHFPLDLLGFSPRVQVTMNSDELSQYVGQVVQLKDQSANVRVKLGIEVDYIPGTEEKLRALLSGYPFDYVIGSIHFMGDWDFTHPAYADDYRNKDLNKLYQRYFALVWEACSSQLFDIIGHIDVVKKFGYRPDSDLESYYYRTAQLMQQTDTCVELNTAGKDAPVGEFYPDRRFLEICRSENVLVTMGSDAHCPEQVGRHFVEGLELLEAVGYRELAVFKDRKLEACTLRRV
ncbi:MAG TPA: histidinol-phosphatase HisJ family protein [Candidatus Limnocylindrales bacterium]|nr:histidinol-phosphatase HisJ family protein [Candidatus Limnocylindrales bacterium]